MARWDPWHGCKKYSEGCLHCYIYKGDQKRGVDTSQIVRTRDFYKPVERLKNGNYKMKPGLVYLAFSTDFLVEEADGWRDECWDMIRQRQDCRFLFLTKRIERFAVVLDGNSKREPSSPGDNPLVADVRAHVRLRPRTGNRQHKQHKRHQQSSSFHAFSSFFERPCKLRSPIKTRKSA